MLRQEDLTFIKSISSLQLFPALLKELRMVLSSRKKKKRKKKKKKKIVVYAESRSTAPGGGPKASQRPSSQYAGKRKTNELAS
jgi:hypothetical protein